MWYRHRDAIIAQRLRHLLVYCVHTHTRTHTRRTSTPQQSISVAAVVAGAERRGRAATNGNSSSRRMCNHAHIALAFVRRKKKSHRRRRTFVIDVVREPVQRRYYRLWAASARYPNNDDCEKGTTASARARADRGSLQSSSVRVSNRVHDARRFVVFRATVPSSPNNNR